MGWLKQSHEKSLLGQLLVQQKLISEEQLGSAIAHQRETGQRLGDILAEWNLLSQHHIQQALRKQRNLRLAATVAVTLFAPLEALAAAPAVGVQVSAQSDATGNRRGMQALSEEDLEGVSAKGLMDNLFVHGNEKLNAHGNDKLKNSGVKELGKLVTAMNPLFDVLDADSSVKDMNFDSARSKATFNSDGSITLNIAATIGELRFDNIRVHGNTTGASFGSIVMKNIDFTGTTVTLAPIRH